MTHATKDSNRSTEGFFNGFRAWRSLILIALVPLAAACTDTVTGLEQTSEGTEARIDGSTDRPDGDDRPVPR